MIVTDIAAGHITDGFSPVFTGAGAAMTYVAEGRYQLDLDTAVPESAAIFQGTCIGTAGGQVNIDHVTDTQKIIVVKQYDGFHSNMEFCFRLRSFTD